MRYIKIGVPDDFDEEALNGDKLSLVNYEKDGGAGSRPVEIWKPPYHNVLNHGFVGLVDFMGDDTNIVHAARVSYGKGTKKVNTDRGLIRYLMRHRHTTPFEMCEFMFHVKAPIFVFRQWHRHRTACLTGDTQLHFDLPGGIKRRGNQLYKLSLEEIYEKFQPTQSIKRPDRQKNPFFKRDRVQSMNLRCLNEDTLEPCHTRIVDIWQNGVKPVFAITTASDNTLTMTKDHLCFTDQGWMRLEEFTKLPTEGDPEWDAHARMSVIKSRSNSVPNPEFNSIDEETERWKPVVGWEDYYEVSSQGRVRRIVGGKGSRGFGECKKLTVTPSGYAVVSLNRPGEQVTKQVHRMLLEAFTGLPLKDVEACHNDGNQLNNNLSNLRWDSSKNNSKDMVDQNRSTRLVSSFDEITSIVFVGEEMTYDVEVDGPWHNFSAEGMVVHNSINEYSGRYSVLDNDFYVPELPQTAIQSTSNRQGREAGSITDQEYTAVLAAMDHIFNDAYQAYEYMLGAGEDGATPAPPDGINNRRLWVEESALKAAQEVRKRLYEKGEELTEEQAEELIEEKIREYYAANELAILDDDFPGIARELARIVLPVATYSQMYWKSNLKNTLHFIGLRSDPHAQWEIRQYSDAMLNLIQPYVPWAIEAFLDYQFEGASLSRVELEAIAHMFEILPEDAQDEDYWNGLLREKGCSVREVNEFMAKLEKGAAERHFPEYTNGK